MTANTHRPVVLATGGDAADFTEDSLLKKFKIKLWCLPTTNGDYYTCDGQNLAMSMGTNDIDFKKVQVYPTLK